MSFKNHGFLGEEAKSLTQQCITKYHDYFTFAEDQNRIAHEALSTFVIYPKLEDTLLSTLLMRGLSSFASLVTLQKLGVEAEAGSSLRNLIEATLHMQKCAVDSAFPQRYVFASERRRYKILTDMLEDKEGHFDFAKQDQDIQILSKRKIEENVPNAASGEREINLANLARELKGAAATLYTLWYRHYANSATHANANSIQRFFRTDEKGNVVQLLYGPQSEELHQNIYIGTMALYLCASSANSHFKTADSLISEMHKQWNDFFSANTFKKSAPADQ